MAQNTVQHFFIRSVSELQPFSFCHLTSALLENRVISTSRLDTVLHSLEFRLRDFNRKHHIPPSIVYCLFNVKCYRVLTLSEPCLRTQRKKWCNGQPHPPRQCIKT